MGVQHKVALHRGSAQVGPRGGSTQGDSTWGFNTRWLYIGVQHKLDLEGVQNKMTLHGGSKQGGSAWGFNTRWINMRGSTTT